MNLETIYEKAFICDINSTHWRTLTQNTLYRIFQKNIPILNIDYDIITIIENMDSHERGMMYHICDFPQDNFSSLFDEEYENNKKILFNVRDICINYCKLVNLQIDFDIGFEE